MIKKIKN